MAKGKTKQEAPWTPVIGELCEVRPRPVAPPGRPLFIPDPRNPVRPWPAGWSLARVDKYVLARFEDGDAQARPRGEGSAVQRDGERGPLLVFNRDGSDPSDTEKPNNQQPKTPEV